MSMRKMVKPLKSVAFTPTPKSRIHYSMSLFLAIFLVLFINSVEADIQTNCTLAANEVILNYTVPVKDADGAAITNATVLLTVDGFMTSVPMDNSTLTGLPVGTYSCAIGRNFTTGNYPTTYAITTDFGITTDTGSFTVTYFDYDIALVVAILIISAVFIYISMKSEDKLMNPLFFFLGLLLLIVNFFIAAELSFNISIQAILTRLYSTLIILFMGGFILYVFLGYFIPFMIKAFGHKNKGEDVEEEVD